MSVPSTHPHPPHTPTPHGSEETLGEGMVYEVVSEDQKESLEVGVGQKRKNVEEDTSDPKRHKEQTSDGMLF